MRIATCLSIAVLALTITASPALAFGRGAAARGARVGPAGGVRTGTAARGVSTGPMGGVHAGGVRTGSYYGPGGTTIQHGTAGGVTRGPMGGVRTGGVSGTRVVGPDGRTYTNAAGAGARVGPAGGVRVGGGAATTVRGPMGGATVGRAGGVAVGPFGATAGGVRTGAVGHRTAYYSPSVVRSTAVGVRGNRYSYFTPTWYRSHANCWVAPRWVAGYNLWRPPVWGTMAAFCGVAAAPLVYDYGSTAVIENDNVYLNGDPVGTAADYAAQADALVDAGRKAKPADADEWQPLGVFGMIQQDEKVAQRIFQLAINKAGVVRGNYYDAVADNTLPVVGSLDKKSQRVAWSIGDKKDIVFETGLSTFTKEEGTVLVHYGKEKTDQMILVRLEEPKGDK